MSAIQNFLATSTVLDAQNDLKSCGRDVEGYVNSPAKHVAGGFALLLSLPVAALAVAARIVLLVPSLIFSACYGAYLGRAQAPKEGLDQLPSEVSHKWALAKHYTWATLEGTGEAFKALVNPFLCCRPKMEVQQAQAGESGSSSRCSRPAPFAISAEDQAQLAEANAGYHAAKRLGSI